MKKIILGALLSTIVGAAFAGNADFTLVNRTGYAINEVFISPSKQSNWGKDRLGENQFMNGQSRKFKFGDTKNCKQDIQVVFTDGGDVTGLLVVFQCDLVHFAQVDVFPFDFIAVSENDLE